jgi:hypothetical protein
VRGETDSGGKLITRKATNKMENLISTKLINNAKSIKDLMVGLTFASVEKVDDGIEFTTTEVWVLLLRHEQVCCESVWLEDITGDLSDLVGVPMVVAEERSEDDWTFYTFRTIKGTVDARWCGTSNGCYSVNADMTVSHPEHLPRGIVKRFNS